MKEESSINFTTAISGESKQVKKEEGLSRCVLTPGILFETEGLRLLRLTNN